MRTLAGQHRPVRALVYAPGATPLLASAGDSAQVHLWDAAAGEMLATLPARREVRALAFSADGRRLAVGGTTASLSVWDVGQRRCEIWSSCGLRPTVAVGFSSDGRAVLAGLRSQTYSGEAGSILTWDLGFLPRDAGWIGEVESVAFAPSRNLFAVGRLDRAVELWDVGRPQRDPFCWLPARIRALCFSPGEADLLAIATGRMIQVWNVRDKAWRSLCKGHRADVFALAFAPDGGRLLSGGMDRSVRLWDVPSGKELAAWDWQLGQIHSVAFAADGMTAAAGGEKPGLVVWDIDEG